MPRRGGARQCPGLDGWRSSWSRKFPVMKAPRGAAGGIAAQARMLVLRPAGGHRAARLPGTVAVLTAGTGDAYVAEECRRTAELMGCYTFRLQARPPSLLPRPSAHGRACMRAAAPTSAPRGAAAHLAADSAA